MTDPRYPNLQTRVAPALAERIRRSASRQKVSVSEWLRLRAEAYLDQAPLADRHGAPTTPVAEREAAAATVLGAAAPTSPEQAREALRKASREITGKAAPNEPQVGPDTPRFRLPHIIQPDGDCAGGCDPDLDDLCLVGPKDPRRTGGRARG